MKYSDRHISDEELDQLFRDAHASEGQEALFVPEFWSDMEAMLPAEPKKKRGFYWIPLAAASILVGMILFYPSDSVKIEHFAQNQHADKIRSGSAATDSNVLTEQEKESVIVENVSVQSAEPTREEVQTEQKNGQTTKRFRVKKTTPVIQETPLDENRMPQDPENVVRTPNSETESDLSHSVSLSDLDSLNLQARYENVPHDHIEGLPASLSKESNEWYVEVGPTLGQSPYLSPDQKRNMVGGAVFGGGYTKRIDNAFVSFGLQARMEGFGGLEYRETNFSPNIVRTVSVKQLYSLEVPLRFGYSFRRSEFAVSVTPGLQLFLHGKERITQNQVLQRENTFTGKVEHSNSLTMEFGLQYYYNITSRFSLGAKLNADILRPFHTDYYLGKSAGLPMNGQIVFRTRFLQ
ncbi:MAG: hypothetical protein ACO1N0_06285 [Fluviicola sp.]